MLFAIISAAICLAAATMMYTPKMRSFSQYRPVGLFFLFEGVWVLADYIIKQMIPDNVFMMIVHYVGLSVIGLYFIFSTVFSSKESFKGKFRDNGDKKDK